MRKHPGLLLTTLSFLRDEPGMLDFANKRALLRTLLATPDLATRAALDIVARVSTLCRIDGRISAQGGGACSGGGERVKSKVVENASSGWRCYWGAPLRDDLARRNWVQDLF